jgi:hypothetical protein
MNYKQYKDNIMPQIQTMSPSAIALMQAQGRALLDKAHADKLSHRTSLGMPNGAYVPKAVADLANRTATPEQLALRDKAGFGRR